jgi:hypothetical protein
MAPLTKREEWGREREGGEGGVRVRERE